MQSNSPYSVQMRGNADENNSEYGHFFMQCTEVIWECGNGIKSCILDKVMVACIFVLLCGINRNAGFYLSIGSIVKSCWENSAKCLRKTHYVLFVHCVKCSKQRHI